MTATNPRILRLLYRSLLRTARKYDFAPQLKAMLVKPRLPAASEGAASAAQQECAQQADRFFRGRALYVPQASLAESVRTGFREGCDAPVEQESTRIGAAFAVLRNLNGTLALARETQASPRAHAAHAADAEASTPALPAARDPLAPLLRDVKFATAPATDLAPGMLLVAHPAQGVGPHFERAVVLVCNVTERAVEGLVLNRPLPHTLSSLHAPHLLPALRSGWLALRDAPALHGGPLPGFTVLHARAGLGALPVGPPSAAALAAGAAAAAAAAAQLPPALDAVADVAAMLGALAPRTDTLMCGADMARVGALHQAGVLSARDFACFVGTSAWPRERLTAEVQQGQWLLVRQSTADGRPVLGSAVPATAAAGAPLALPLPLRADFAAVRGALWPLVLRKLGGEYATFAQLRLWPKWDTAPSALPTRASRTDAAKVGARLA